MPGWYGVANVKWLAEIHLQENRFLGNYQARWYRTLRAVGGSGEDADPQTQFVETEVTRLNLKSVIARVRKTAAGDLRVLGFVLNDGTPLRSVEVKVDDGPWQPAQLDAANTQYSWKLFTYRWTGATPGEHTHRLARHRRHRRGAADRRRAGAQADLPRGQLAVPAEGQGGVRSGAAAVARRSNSATPMPATASAATAYTASICALR